jgi:hypothetical protein
LGIAQIRRFMAMDEATIRSTYPQIQRDLIAADRTDSSGSARPPLSR